MISMRIDLKNALKSILYEGGEGNFVIISNGEYYMQYSASRGDTGIHCEVVSNQFLPRKNRIDKEKMKEILNMGFNPPSSIPNFNKYYEINTDKQLDEVIEELEQIFYGIFSVDMSSDFEIELNLED